MKFTKRAFLFAIGIYVATFISGILAGIIAGTNFASTEPLSGLHWALSILFSFILAIIISFFYFRDKTIKVTARAGLNFSYILLIVIAIGEILSSIIFTIRNGFASVVSYYSDPFVYLSILLIFLTPIAVGAIKGRE